MGLAAPVPPVDDLAVRLLAALGEGPVVLAGHSQSCQVVAAAARDPRVRGVVLFGPTTDPRMRPLPVLAWRWVCTVMGEPWWQVARGLAQGGATRPRPMAPPERAAPPDPLDPPAS